MSDLMADLISFSPLYRRSQASSIGAGGCCAGVQKWTCLRTHQECAVKVLSVEFVKCDNFLVDNEIRALQAARWSGVSHVVQLLDRLTGRSGAQYLVLEYLPGKTIETVAVSQIRDESLTLSVGAQLLQALGDLHTKARIAHMDVTTSNIMLLDGVDNEIRLIDFGFARPLRSGRVRPHGLTDSFAAPEVLFPLLTEDKLAAHQKRVDGTAADMWSAGVVLFRLLTGRLPFSAPGSVTESGFPPDMHDPEDRKKWEARAVVYNGQHSWACALTTAEATAHAQRTTAVVVNHPVTDRIRAHSACPDDAADFFRRIFDTDVTTRLTVQQAQTHPWMQTAVAKLIAVDCKPKASTTCNKASSVSDNLQSGIKRNPQIGINCNPGCGSVHNSESGTNGNSGSGMQGNPESGAKSGADTGSSTTDAGSSTKCSSLSSCADASSVSTGSDPSSCGDDSCLVRMHPGYFCQKGRSLPLPRYEDRRAHLLSAVPPRPFNSACSRFQLSQQTQYDYSDSGSESGSASDCGSDLGSQAMTQSIVSSQSHNNETIFEQPPAIASPALSMVASECGSSSLSTSWDSAPLPDIRPTQLSKATLAKPFHSAPSVNQQGHTGWTDADTDSESASECDTDFGTTAVPHSSATGSIIKLDMNPASISPTSLGDMSKQVNAMENELRQLQQMLADAQAHQLVVSSMAEQTSLMEPGVLKKSSSSALASSECSSSRGSNGAMSDHSLTDDHSMETSAADPMAHSLPLQAVQTSQPLAADSSPMYEKPCNAVTSASSSSSSNSSIADTSCDGEMPFTDSQDDTCLMTEEPATKSQRSAVPVSHPLTVSPAYSMQVKSGEAAVQLTADCRAQSSASSEATNTAAENTRDTGSLAAGSKTTAGLGRAIVGNALAVPVACAAVSTGVAIVSATGACLAGYATCKAVSYVVNTGLSAMHSTCGHHASAGLVSQLAPQDNKLKSEGPALNPTADCAVEGTVKSAITHSAADVRGGTADVDSHTEMPTSPGGLGRAIVGNALAVPVACATLTAGMAVAGTAAACLTGYAAYKTLSFGFGHIKGCAS